MFTPKSLSQCNEKVIDVSDANYKRVIVSVLLSIFPGMGQVYSNEIYRGIFAYLGLIFLSWLSAYLFINIESTIFSLIILSIPFVYAFAVCIDAAFCAIRNHTKINHKKSKIMFNILGFLILFYSINTLTDHLVGKHIVRAFFVTSPSMSPNIYKHDLVLIDKMSRPSIGDVVLIDFKKVSSESSISNIIMDQTLRRIVATEGDTVKIRGKQLYINDIPLNEEYALHEDTDTHNIYNYHDYKWGPESVPKNSFFVLSDSRQFGFDSRIFGTINKEQIHGIARKVLWSWNLDEGKLKWSRTALAIK